MKSSVVTVTDLFCGAGGSSLGAEAMGAELRMAANHWSLAIETHASNFPNADHDCADVSQVDPRRYPSTDVLLASPECTFHSQARTKKHTPNLFNPNGDPMAERSRATMWDVPRFAERHHYQLVVVENVVEAATRWPPFQAWLQAMDALGYAHKVVSLNSMVAHPTPQSRDRLYVVFWKRGNRAPDLDIRPHAWCPSCEQRVDALQVFKRPDRFVGKYRQQYLYRCPKCSGVAFPYAWPAASAIDWSLPCPRIGDRAKPLAEATLRRIRVGLERFGPAIVQKSGHTYEHGDYVRAWPVGAPMPTQTTEIHHALVVPTHRDGSVRARSTGEPWPTQTGRQELGFVMVNRTHNRPRGFGEPFAPFCTADHQGIISFVAELRGGASDVRGVDEPLSTLTGGGQHHALVMKNYGDGSDPSMCKPADRHPFGAVTAIDHHSLVVPYTPGRDHAKPVSDPLATVVTRDHFGLVSPALPDVDDCGFRMLEPHEIGRAMAFPDSYAVLGNKRQRVRQYGNAVTPPVMSMILERAIASLGGRA